MATRDLDLLAMVHKHALYMRECRPAAGAFNMFYCERMKPGEEDDASEEFNATLYKALDEGYISHAELEMLGSADTIVKGRKSGIDATVYAVVDAPFRVTIEHIDNVCQRAAIIGKLFPDAVVYPLLYYYAKVDDAPALQAMKRGVALQRSAQF